MEDIRALEERFRAAGFTGPANDLADVAGSWAHFLPPRLNPLIEEGELKPEQVNARVIHAMATASDQIKIELGITDEQLTGDKIINVMKRFGLLIGHSLDGSTTLRELELPTVPTPVRRSLEAETQPSIHQQTLLESIKIPPNVKSLWTRSLLVLVRSGSYDTTLDKVRGMSEVQLESIRNSGAAVVQAIKAAFG